MQPMFKLLKKNSSMFFCKRTESKVKCAINGKCVVPFYEQIPIISVKIFLNTNLEFPIVIKEIMKQCN